ncbi:hypothetical protein, partial [Candidatus Thiosymbion oneisti]
MSNWLQDFKKPINLISLIVSILSLSFALITYDSRSDGRELSYNILTGKILESDPLTQVIEIFFKDGAPINGDVYVAYMSLWNSGKIAINSSDVTRGIEVHMNSSGHFLDAEKIHVRGDGIGRVETIEVSEKVIKLELDQLDLDMGAKYKILYIDSERENIGITSIVYSLLLPSNNSRNNTINILGHIKEGNIVDANSFAKRSFVVGLISSLFVGTMLLMRRLVKIAACLINRRAVVE